MKVRFGFCKASKYPGPGVNRLQCGGKSGTSLSIKLGSSVRRSFISPMNFSLMLDVASDSAICAGKPRHSGPSKPFRNLRYASESWNDCFCSSEKYMGTSSRGLLGGGANVPAIHVRDLA